MRLCSGAKLSSSGDNQETYQTTHHEEGPEGTWSGATGDELCWDYGRLYGGSFTGTLCLYDIVRLRGDSVKYECVFLLKTVISRPGELRVVNRGPNNGTEALTLWVAL